jgi:hypothetical protein
MTGRVRLCVLGAVTALVAMQAISPALAHDHKPPRVVLTSGAAEQPGQLGTHCWTSAGEEPGYYETYCADYIWSFPSPERARARRSATITIHKTTAPDQLDLRRYRSVGEDGRPTGDGKPINYKIAPQTVDGKVVYEVTFTTARPGHMYIDMFGIWEDTEGGNQPQDANWTFHLKLH